MVTSHNIVLDIGTRSGLIGVALLLVAVIASLADGLRVWRRHRNPQIAALALGMVVVVAGVLGKGMVESTFEKYRLNVALGLALGIIAAAATSLRTESDLTHPGRGRARRGDPRGSASDARAHRARAQAVVRPAGSARPAAVHPVATIRRVISPPARPDAPHDHQRPRAGRRARAQRRPVAAGAARRDRGGGSHAQGRGRPPVQPAPPGRSGRGPARRRDPLGGVARRRRAPGRAPGVDHRPARRHPRVLRGPGATGPCTSPCGRAPA